MVLEVLAFDKAAARHPGKRVKEQKWEAELLLYGSPEFSNLVSGSKKMIAGRKKTKTPIKLGDLTKKFPSKLLMAPPGFFWLLLVK